MTVFFKESFNLYTIGSADFFNAFFSTISYQLENKIVGSRFPIIMKELYMGKLYHNKIQDAISEIHIIKKEFSTMPSDKLIWDFEDLTKLPPKIYLNSEKTLLNLFITVNGDNLIELLIEVLRNAYKNKRDVEIVNRAVKEVWYNPEQ
jgi:hypothetical protein